MSGLVGVSGSRRKHHSKEKPKEWSKNVTSSETSTIPMINLVRPGDNVRYVDSQGSVHNARITMRSSYPNAWVANSGGRFGRPVIISDKNLVGIKKRS